MTAPCSRFDPKSIRNQFPSLNRLVDGHPAIFADGPGGTQVPQAVGVAMDAYLRHSNANAGGPFATSIETGVVIANARECAAALLHAQAHEIIFGQNMTSLTFSMSRALARTWQPGDEVVVTALDHDANVAPWMLAAEDRGVHVRLVPFDRDCTITPEALQAALSPRTRLVALGYASNAVGSIVDLEPLVRAAHASGALVYVDAVHYAPHGVIDAKELDCDFLACSAYKFCGPHLGILFGRGSLLETLTPYKVRPSTMIGPGKWETGTQNFEALAGFQACVDYLASLSGLPASTRGADRVRLVAAMQRIREHERMLSQRFLSGLAEHRDLHVHGFAVPEQSAKRTPTFGLTLDTMTPRQANEQLARQGIFCWDGHFYAKGFVDQLGLSEQGGVLRIGFAHYTTEDEVDAILLALRQLRR